MQHCINELESNINIQYIRSYFYVALQLFDTTNGLQKEKKTCMKPLPHLFSLWTSPQATDPQSLMHFLFFHQTLALHCFTVTPNKTSVQACNLTNICQLWNPELQHFTLILLFLHTQTRHMGPLPPVQMGIRRRPLTDKRQYANWPGCLHNWTPTDQTPFFQQQPSCSPGGLPSRNWPGSTLLSLKQGESCRVIAARFLKGFISFINFINFFVTLNTPMYGNLK